MSSQLPWHVARAGGIVAWALVAGSVIWGLTLSTRALGRRPRPAWLFDLHRFLGGLAVVFTVVHVLAVVADSYVDFSLVNVLVPLTGEWHPLAVAWGIVGLYLLLAVELTSLAMARLPRRLWRRVHMASFLVFAATSVHALTAGTDRRSAAFLVAVALACGVVALLTAIRVRDALTATIAGSMATTGIPRRPPGSAGRQVAPAARRRRPPAARTPGSAWRCLRSRQRRRAGRPAGRRTTSTTAASTALR